MFSPHHVRLVSSCYPATPLAAGPDFKPNAQELSRLTYFGSNKPGKLAKIGSELEKHAQSESRRAASGHPKARASLLITLEILKSLCAECRQELSLFGRSIVISVDYAMSALTHDLEVVARSASVFTAYTTFTDGKSSVVDETLAKSYLSVLKKFAAMSTWTGRHHEDEELRARSRLVGLAVLTSAIASDALYSSLELGKAQVATIVPALMFNVQEAGLTLLQQQEIAVEESQANSPYFTEFQPQRPLSQRRAASIHAHQDGVEGPTMKDVTFGALKAIKNLLGRSDGPQVGMFLASLFETLDNSGSWGDINLCRWLALNITEWTQYQHRYAIPVRLVNKLMETPDNSPSAKIHESLLAMITAVFSSRTPIANLATSDVISSLLEFILRRVERDPHDHILPAVVNCVSSLATHLYYADQIQDFAEEIIRKLTEVQLANLSADSLSRREGMRCLISCLAGLIKVAAKHTTSQEVSSHSPGATHDQPDATDAAADAATQPPERGASVGSVGGRRNLISPETWQDTLAILCEADYGLRADYARALSMFISSELPQGIVPSTTESNLSLSTSSHPKGHVDFSGSDETIRFLNAMHATVYTLAVAPTLGLSANATATASDTSTDISSEPSPITEDDISTADTAATVQLNFIDSTPVQSPVAEETPPSTFSAARGYKASTSPSSHRGGHRSRTASLALSLIDASDGPRLASPALAPACPSDYSHAVAIMSSAIQRTPAKAILTGVPMLLALDKISCAGLASNEDDVLRGRRQALREAIAQVWSVIALAVESPELQEFTEKAHESVSSSTVLPKAAAVRDGFVQPSEAPTTFPSLATSDEALPALPAGPLPPTVNPEAALTILSSSSKLQQITQLDRSSLLRKLAVQWTPALAITNSMESFPTHDNGSRVEGSMPFLKLAPALMHIDNKSLQSLARSTRNVGVGDLREALEGRSSANRSTVGLGYPGSPSMSSIGHHSAAVDHSNGEGGGFNQLQARLRAASAIKEANGEVKEILNKLGIGRQSTTRNRTKGAFKSPLLPSPKRGSSDTSNTVTQSG